MGCSSVLRLAAVCAGVVCLAAAACAGQGSSTQPPFSSLGAELSRMEGREVHIFFIHGIGSNGPGAHDSLPLRQAICAYLKDCASQAGDQIGPYDYADRRQFLTSADPPKLLYMNRPIWATAEEWNAAAPFAVHYKLSRTHGAPVFVDELNWWPLTLALKCREIIASDARLAGPSEQRIKTCSTREPDPQVKNRFVSYDWITPEEAKRLEALPRHSAMLNHTLKNNLSDWGFADAILSLGPMHKLMVNGIRQLILKSVAASEATPNDESGIFPAPRQEFVIVTHSLGSYLIFSALNLDDVTARAGDGQPGANAFLQVLRQTSLVYFFANQVPLLELADLQESKPESSPVSKSEATQAATEAAETSPVPQTEFAQHLEQWGELHCAYQQSLMPKEQPVQPCRKPRIVALNDSSDLLTWRVPPLKSVDVENLRVKNALHWFWLIEDPTKAHDNYPKDKRAIKQMLHPSTPPKDEK